MTKFPKQFVFRELLLLITTLSILYMWTEKSSKKYKQKNAINLVMNTP